MVWLTGAALVVCLLLIISLLTIVVVGGASAFWPRAIEVVSLRPEGAGVSAEPERFVGVPIRDEPFEAGAGDKAAALAMKAAGTIPPGSIDDQGRLIQRLYRVGNREFNPSPFRYVPLYRIAATERRKDLILAERMEWSVWLGVPTAVVLDTLGTREILDERAASLPAASRIEVAPAAIAPGASDAGTEPVLRERRYLHEGDATRVLAELGPLMADARARRNEIESIKTTQVGRINAQLTASRERIRTAELSLERWTQGRTRPLHPAAWILGLAIAIGAGAAAIVLLRRAATIPARLATFALASVAIAGVLMAALENPLRLREVTTEEVAVLRGQESALQADLNTQFEVLRERLRVLDERDARHRVVLTDPVSQRFAPLTQSDPGEPIRVSQLVRIVRPNALDAAGKISVYASRWWEFLSSSPRAFNTEGGVFPVIFGTVLLTILLSVAVVPLGVIAAVYLREYATQGPIVSALRVAINNLAGVPSIVYGIFGYSFFVVGVGRFVDRGPEAPMSRPGWWIAIGALILIIALAFAASLMAGRFSGDRRQQQITGVRKLLTPAAFAAVMWLLATFGAIALIVTTPYFGGFFPQRDGGTFASKGLLWSALTLALLTLPVVIVATEEAIAAVPRSMREGSYGCGASKWQTVSRIVLPRSMPGIMTGTILAMARGAGEVAPIMLVGVMKLASELPVSTEPPFLYLQRPFMHLGFHIYDLGFQAPDSEAAKPIVWCTTLLLIAVVIMLNIAAIRLRSNLRKRYMGEAF